MVYQGSGQNVRPSFGSAAATVLKNTSVNAPNQFGIP